MSSLLKLGLGFLLVTNPGNFGFNFRSDLRRLLNIERSFILLNSPAMLTTSCQYKQEDKYMSENKVNLNPPFSEDGTATPSDDTELDTEVKPSEEEEEGNLPESSAGEEPIRKDGAVDLDLKQRELKGLESEQEKIIRENVDYDRLIQERRAQIVSARMARREKKEELHSIPELSEPEDDLSDIDQEDIARLQRVLKKEGYVKKGEIEELNFTSSKSQAEKDFFAAHSEYAPESDVNNVLYDALREEFGLFARPKDPAMVKKLLDKAHIAVRDRFPQHFAKQGNLSADQARRHKMQVAGMGAGASGASSQKSEPVLTTAQREELVRGGFDPEEVKNW